MAAGSSINSDSTEKGSKRAHTVLVWEAMAKEKTRRGEEYNERGGGRRNSCGGRLALQRCAEAVAETRSCTHPLGSGERKCTEEEEVDAAHLTERRWPLT